MRVNLRGRLVAAILCVLFLCLSTYAQEPGEDLKVTQSDYTAVGWELMSQGKLKEANNSFSEAVKLNPENIEALQGLGRTYIYLDENKEAEPIFKKILELDEDNIIALVWLARIYSWDNKFDDSIKLYKRALEIGPKNADAISGLAEVYSWAGYSEESINRYEEILAQDPRNLKAYKEITQIYTWDNRLKEGEKIYKQALEVLPDSIDLHLGLAKISTWMTLWSQAETEYKKVLELDPENKEALDGLGGIEKQLVPQDEAVFKYIRETDGNNWHTRTLNLGYKHTKLLDRSNSIYVAYYFNEFKETGYSDKFDNGVELGGKYLYKDNLTLLSFLDISNYSNGPVIFAGGDFAAILTYYKKNTISLKTTRDIFDPLDEIRSWRYAAESNIYLNDYLLLTDSYVHSDLSDGNYSRDHYHNINFLISKKTPDLNMGFAWRYRDFNEGAPKYYSPQDLESRIYSFFLGGRIDSNYLYHQFKYIDNSTHVDDFYILLGCDHKFNGDWSLVGELSYFETEGKYSALTSTLSYRFKF